jgi:Tfp pilus assembly protein PilZ
MTHQRYRTAIKAEFEVGRLRGQGRIQNVTEGGLFVGTAQVPHEGELVSVSFRHGGRSLDVHGLVWWTTKDTPGHHRGPGFGMRLLEDSADYGRFLDTLRG